MSQRNYFHPHYDNRQIQILKRHRDVMFIAHPEAKPISVIITTLAAEAYKGETNVDEAMINILRDIESLVSRQIPRVPNPVNPAEDFAEKWGTREGLSMRLEDNFWMWVELKFFFNVLHGRFEFV